MVYGGATPDISVAEAEAMGYKIVIFPFAALSPAYGAIKQSFEMLKKKGEVGQDAKMPPKSIFEIVGLRDSLKIDAEAGGLAYTNGV